MGSFINNFKKLHWDSYKETNKLFIKVLIYSLIITAVLVGLEYVSKLLLGAL